MYINRFRIAIIVGFFVGILPKFTISQTSDSLLLQLYHEPKDSARVEILIKLSVLYSEKERNFQLAENYLFEAKKLTEQIPSKPLDAKVLNKLGQLYRNFSKYNEALKYHNEALSLAKEIGDSSFEAYCLNNIGVVYRRVDNHSIASEYHLKALLLAEDIKDTFNISIACNSLGNIFSLNGNYNQALEYYSKALALSIFQHNLLGQAMNYNNVGEVYEFMGDWTKAKEYYQKSLDFNEIIKSEKGIAINYNALGKIAMFQGDVNTAYKYFSNALEIDKKLGDQKFLADSYVNVANALVEKGKFKESWDNIQKGLSIAKEIKSLFHCELAYETLSKYYKKQGLYNEALNYYILASQYKDSVLNEKNSRHISTIQTLYETKKKEDEITLLTKQKELKQQEIHRKSIQTIALLIGLFLSIVAVISIYFVLRTKRKLNVFLSKQVEEIEKQNILLEEKNQEIQLQKEEIELNKNFIEQKNKNLEEAYKLIEGYIEKITDSLRYAERIQESIQPSVESILSVFKDTFIFNRPKDIVSGDFHWMSIHGKLTYFALADCTGHGVPGAFMSIIGIDMLNQAVNHYKLHRTDDIVSFIDESLLKRLSPSPSENVLKDSLDIAVCVYDAENFTLEYTGALIPLFINVGGEVEEIKPDYITLGSRFSRFERKFTINKMKLKPGDWIYLTSDGYLDQLGGELNKKYMRSRLKKTLSRMANFEGTQIKDILEYEFLQWMKRNEQVDDVLVWGIKV